MTKPVDAARDPRPRRNLLQPVMPFLRRLPADHRQHAEILFARAATGRCHPGSVLAGVASAILGRVEVGAEADELARHRRLLAAMAAHPAEAEHYAYHHLATRRKDYC